jgi:hypothetical protein
VCGLTAHHGFESRSLRHYRCPAVAAGNAPFDDTRLGCANIFTQDQHRKYARRFVSGPSTWAADDRAGLRQQGVCLDVQELSEASVEGDQVLIEMLNACSNPGIRNLVASQ